MNSLTSKGNLIVGIGIGLMLAGLIILAFGCSNQSDVKLDDVIVITPPDDPVCERPDFSDSWICAQLKEAGFEYAETAQDLILDANDISLILEVYTEEDLAIVLDTLEGYLDFEELTYTLFFEYVIDDVSKAKRVVSILKRRFKSLKSLEAVRLSDRELLRLSIQGVRDATGIE